MDNKLIMLVIVVLVSAMSLTYFAPTQVMRRSAAHALEAVAEAVESKDHAKISESLRALITDDAKIRLEVSFLGFSGEGRPIVQEFPDKQAFITFVDNVLYPLTDLIYHPSLKTLETSADRKTAAVIFKSSEWGDGNSLYGGTSVEVRYSSDTECNGNLLFSGSVSDAPKLSEVSCVMQLRMLPKAGQADKFRDMNAIQDLLKKS